MGTCACGPPTAVTLYKKTFFKNGMCRSNVVIQAKCKKEPALIAGKDEPENKKAVLTNSFYFF